MNKSPAHIQRSSAAIQRQEPFFAPRPAVSNNRAVEETESLQGVGGGQISGSLLSPRKDQVQTGASPRENDPRNMIQRTGVIDQSTPTNHRPNLVYPWG
ncbi:MAG: hypothetical protein SFV22_04335, partial [Saprospiraceae bacterium]|nr:hypothetical protein [Saprospiraceae bacterium]